VRRGHVIALIGALALLLIMALDWYGSATGDEAREVQRNAENIPQLSEEEDDARSIAEGQEKNAWQADALIDRILLAVLLATIVFAIVTAVTRAAGAKPTKGLGPAGATALLAAVGAILVAYRIIQEPGLDAGTNVKAGAPLALLALGMIGLGASSALRADEREEETADAGPD
jgi:hypothetical protein